MTTGQQYGTVLVGFSINAEINTSTHPDDIRELHRSTVEEGVQIIKRVSPFDFLKLSVSGSSRNVVSAIARCGHNDIRLLGTIAQDLFGQFIVQQLTEEGVEFSPLLARLRTNLSINTASRGEDPGVLSQNFKADYQPGQIAPVADRIQQEVKRTRPIFRVTTGVQISDAPLAEAMFSPAHAADGTLIQSTNVLNLGITLLQTSQDRETETARIRWVKKILKLTHLLSLNQSELNELLLSLNIQSVERLRLEVQNPKLQLIVTCGGDGAKYYAPNEPDLSIDAFPARKVIDPTGAGDCFLGNFIAHTISGFDRKEALVRSAAASALAVEKLGGDTSPKIEDTLAFLEYVKRLS